jgi:hypothetical protein
MAASADASAEKLVKPDTAFDTHQVIVNADPDSVRQARRRRNIFCDAFGELAEVRQTIPSGSLARGTQCDPIHDVDLIMVFRADEHPDWDNGSGSAEAALEHTRRLVTQLLGASGGTFARKVRRADLRNHVVKCFLDDPGDPLAFTVEVMPALRDREGGPLRVPERHADRWVTADPEYLIAAVAGRHKEWRYFAPMVRTIKKWKDATGLGIKSLTAEVLALNCLPRPEVGVELTRAAALSRFFTSAATAVMSGVADPAGWCGEIQPDLDRYAARAALLKAGDIAARTLDAEEHGDYDTAVCLWRSVFGTDFPDPPGGCPGSGTGSALAGAAVLAAPALLRRPVRDAPQG